MVECITLSPYRLIGGFFKGKQWLVFDKAIKGNKKMPMNTALFMFNQYYSVGAKMVDLGEDVFLFTLNNGMKEIKGEGEAIHFLMCRTTHYLFIPNRNGGGVFNLAMQVFNRTYDGKGSIYFSENNKGKITLWVLAGGKWEVITTFENKTEFYRFIFTPRKKRETPKKMGFIQRVKEWFK